MNVIELNRDTERDVLALTGISFVHFSDVHAKPELWNRITEYIDHYKNVISFGLHTGDYCGGSQKVYADMYLKKCSRPIYNCVGNHDCYSGEGAWLLNDKKVAHSLLFNHTEDWNVTFFECPYSMCYYIDCNDLRIIVLDDYHDIWPARPWLRSVLKEAYSLNMHVITAQHEPTGYISNTYGSLFSTVEDYVSKWKQYELNRINYDFDHRGRVLYEDVIKEFISYGGRYVCNLAGHDHVDQFGLTSEGILNIAIQNATTWDALGDTRRVIGERSEDCFNVMSVDTGTNTLTLIRIGANTDVHGRQKNVLKFDYSLKKIIEER